MKKILMFGFCLFNIISAAKAYNDEHVDQLLEKIENETKTRSPTQEGRIKAVDL